MSQDTQRDQISKKRVVYTMPGMEAVPVRRDEPYRVTDAGPLTMDVYYPPDAKAGARTPAVIFVTGFSDPGAEKMLGSKFKDMGSFVSWAQLVALSGLVGITYANKEPADVHAVLHHVQQNGALLGIDGNRIGVWACSGHGPNALSVLMEHGRDGLPCAVLAYAYTLDLDGSTRIADAAKQFRFVIPAAGKSCADLPRDLPLFVARAGRDEMPGLNDALDQVATWRHMTDRTCARLRDAESSPRPAATAANRAPLFDDRDEVVRRDTADAAIRSRIARRRNECLVAGADGTIEIARRVFLVRLVHQHQRAPGPADGIVALRRHAEDRNLTDMKCRRRFWLQLHGRERAPTRPEYGRRNNCPAERGKGQTHFHESSPPPERFYARSRMAV